MSRRDSIERETSMNAKRIRILAVHQGAELYGSDRCFAQSVTAFRKRWPDSEIIVRLGSHGPLTEKLIPHADRIQITPLWIARKTQNPGKLGLDLLKALFRLPRIFQELREFDLVYINTIVVIDYLLTSQFVGRKALLHVHEITPDSKLGRLLRVAVRNSKARKIFNSLATRDSYSLADNEKSVVIYNGVAGPQYPEATNLRNKLHLLLLGRISDWKGQDLAIDALGLIPATGRKDIHLRIVGGTFFGQEAIADALVKQIQGYGLHDNVTIIPFSSNVEAHYAWADAVLVPSRRPEPFGLVAIEAMAHRRTPIIAEHGGLAEIVVHGQSGLKFRPNDAEALAQAITIAAQDPQGLARLSEGARQRYEDCFTEARMERDLIATVEAHLKR